MEEKKIKLAQIKERQQRLRQENEELKSELEKKILQMYVTSQKISEIRQMSETINLFQEKQSSIQKSIQEQNDEILKHKKICADREAIVKERITYIKAFNLKFQDEYEACQKKLFSQTIDIRDTVIKGIKRLFLLQLYIMKVFQALSSVQYNIQDQLFIPNQQQEEQIGCSLGYLTLLVQAISKICGLNLRYQLYFRGSKSYLIRNQNEYSYLLTKLLEFIIYFGRNPKLNQSIPFN